MWFDHDGVRIYYEESGAGAPLLLMPGWSGTLEDIGVVREALAAKYRVIAADLPGSGKSQPQPRSYPTTYYHDDARAMLALLHSLDAAPAHLVGFSDGGEYALVMAEQEPAAVRSVVTWGSAGKLPDAPDLAEAMGSVIDAPIPPMQGFSEYLKGTYGEANARAMSKSFSEALLGIMKAGGDISRARAAEIACPALIIIGEEDFIAPPPLAEDMARAIPRGEYAVAKGASHSIHHEQGEWLTGTITDWLTRQK